jgi:hypothetical protein
VTTLDKYSLPILAKHAKPFQRLAGLQRFFKNRPCQGLSPNSCCTCKHPPQKKAIMLFGLFEYLFMPFWLSNATQTFQQMMDHTTDSLEGVFEYMDDSCVSSPDRQTHLLHWEVFFYALATNGLPINLKKMCFCSALFVNSWPHNFGDRIGP